MAKEFFETDGLDGVIPRAENAVINNLVEGARTFLYGRYNGSDIHNRLLAQKMVDQGWKSIKAAAELTALMFDISPHRASDVVDVVYSEVEESYHQTPGLSSIIAAGMAEGFMDAGEKELAAGLFDLKVIHPGVQRDMMVHLLLNDPLITNKHP